MPQDSISLLERLKELFPDCSSSTLRSWLKHGRVLVNEQVVKIAKTPVTAKQTVSVGKKKEMCSGKIEILYEDPHLLVVHKPTGLLSVATERVVDFTAHSFLKRHYYPKPVYVVHRLDRDTSGLMVFARSEPARDAFKDALAAHNVEREYMAVLEGQMESQEGTWDSYLVDGQDCVVRPTTADKGKRAITHYTLVNSNELYSLVAFSLETGRKNQIRVHCQQAGHPITGDSKYGAKEKPLKRLALHAWKLSFEHPISGKPMKFETDVPRSFFKITA